MKRTKPPIEQVIAFLNANPGAGRATVAAHFNAKPETVRCWIAKARSTGRVTWETSDVPQPQRKTKPVVAPVEPPTVEEDIVAARERARDQRLKALEKSYKQVLDIRAAEDQIIDEFRSLLSEMRDSGQFQINIAPPAPMRTGPGKPEEAILIISDTHVGKTILPQHTLGFGHYNPLVFLWRMKFLEETVIHLLRNNIVNPVAKLHIWLLGDLIEGMLSHAEEIPNRTLVVDQVAVATMAFYQMIANVSRVVPVEVDGLGGNHARWGTQKKPPTANRFSNFDFIVLEQVQALIQHTGLDNVTMDVGEGAFKIKDVQGWRFKLGHGDHLKGGDKAMGIPAHAIGREMNGTTARFAATNQKVPDYYIVGDKHKPFVGPTATGRYMINGAWFESDEYAISSNFPPCRPFQMFFGVHPKHGRSWSYDLSLDAAPLSDELPYTLPSRLVPKVKAFAK